MCQECLKIFYIQIGNFLFLLLKHFLYIRYKIFKNLCFTLQIDVVKLLSYYLWVECLKYAVKIEI